MLHVRGTHFGALCCHTLHKGSFTQSDFIARQELRSNGDFTATANRACEQPAISLRFVEREIAALWLQIRTCSKFSATLRSSSRAIKSLCVNKP